MGDMKEIRDAALAYYYNLSKEQQQEVYTFFQAMDIDGDGGITIKEFQQIFISTFSVPRDSVNHLFREMDKNGDGVLDFEEAITLYYVLSNDRMVGCDGCKTPFLKGLYFTCVDCFDHSPTDSFDLCISCFGSRNYVHEHCNFLDNYAILRSKSAQTSSANSVDASDYEDYQVPRSKSLAALNAINTGLEIGNAVGNVVVAASSCIIM
ncbi:hypothetical protein ACLB2K_039390 [Fragaria x ananassa]